MKKIAIPTNKGMVDDHFGHCKYYTIYSIDDNKNIRHKETLPSPNGCGCKSNIASELKNLGVTIMLAGSMGNGAYKVLEESSINTVRGCSGPIEDVLNRYLNNQLIDSGYACLHVEENHTCQH